MTQSSKTVSIARRDTDEVGTVLDVTGWSERNFAQMWDGLVRQVDFESWMPVYSPERGENETAAQWLAR